MGVLEFEIREQATGGTSHDGSTPLISVSTGASGTFVSVDQGQGRLVEIYALTPAGLVWQSTEPRVQQFYRGTVDGASLAFLTQTVQALTEGEGAVLFSRDTGALATAVAVMPITVGGSRFLVMGGGELAGLHSLYITARTLNVAGEIHDTAALRLAGITALASVETALGSYVFAASGPEDGVSSFRIGAAGDLTLCDTISPATGAPINAPQVLRTTQVAGNDFLIVGAALSSSLTVFSIAADGRLTQTDHRIDDRNSRFAGAAVMDAISVNGLTYVVAAGTDDGLTLFLLLPTGRLLQLAVIEDQLNIGLDNVTGITLFADAEGLHVFATSQSEAGLAHLRVPIDPLSRLVSGGAGADLLQGGAADDVLTDGGGSDTLAGGAGSDLFVLSADGTSDQITDFTPGEDKLDLSAWWRLYATDQLQISAITDGARIQFGAEVLFLHTSNGRSLDYDDFLATDMLGLARIPIAPPPPPPVATPLDLTGTAGRDTLIGDEGNDTLHAGDDADLVQAGGGNDLVFGGSGADTVTGDDGDDTIDGGTGADWIDGGGGNDSLNGDTSTDIIYGGAGHDTITGGTGADTIYGGDGDDVILGNTAVDLIYGGAGNDSISSGDGVDVVYGGEGNDTVIGRSGWDTLFGDGGDDLIYGSDGQDDLFGGSGDDFLSGGYGWDRLYGGDGADTVYGNIGADILFGDGGADLLSGGTGDDLLIGGDGADSLFGNQGVDTLEGGAGNDELRGGTLADTFIFRPGSGQDIITDFEHQQDMVLVSEEMLMGLTIAEFLDQHTMVTANGLLLEFAGADSLFLQGITETRLILDNFAFL